MPDIKPNWFYSLNGREVSCYAYESYDPNFPLAASSPDGNCTYVRCERHNLWIWKNAVFNEDPTPCPKCNPIGWREAETSSPSHYFLINDRKIPIWISEARPFESAHNCIFAVCGCRNTFWVHNTRIDRDSVKSCKCPNCRPTTWQVVDPLAVEKTYPFHCADCRKGFDSELEDYLNHNSDGICESCSQNYGVCQDCERTVRNTRLEEYHIYQGDDRTICRDCVREYTECNSCQILVSSDNNETYPSPSGSICESCAENTSCCEDCGEVMWSDDARYLEDDDGNDCGPYCGHCVEKQEVSFSTDSETYNENRFRQFVGLELEILHSINTSILRDSLRGLGQLKSDGSLEIKEGESFNHTGEIVLRPANGDRLFNNIDKVCDIIAGQSGVNTTCGFHLHLDCRNSTLSERENFFSAFTVFERVFTAMAPPSRLGNSYCKTISNFNGKYDEAIQDERYKTLNVTAFHKHRTLEVRLHAGTTDRVKIKNWCSLMLNFYAVFSKIEMNDKQFSEMRGLNNREILVALFQMVKIPMSLRKYIVRRIKKQNGRKKEFYRFDIPNRKRVENQKRLEFGPFQPSSTVLEITYTE